ncbi:MAG: insulinase family protein [Prevotellaceae bacterium]|jgi:predicted Zn-dependent peptidase|nr:insulinase family protein [Prevotellaceae bacterium]
MYHTLHNGIRIIFEKQPSNVTCCGMIIDCGSRDEADNEQGIAHFIEHLLFKGAEKRNSRQIINRIENVGGELNAFTAKEETVVYCSILHKYTERAVELIGDIVLHSTFPEDEIEKERDIILDEICSYHDNPSELIFDDFEEQIFDKYLGHNILGTKKILRKIKRKQITEFYQKNYLPEKMAFFIVGNFEFDKIIRWAEKYFVLNENLFEDKNINLKANSRQKTAIYTPATHIFKKKTHQTHCIFGNRAYKYSHPNYLTFSLLNNILGGPNMNSLLNLQLREKHALVYQVDANYQPFTDTAVWTVYFGCDKNAAEKCDRIVRRELQKLCDKPISNSALHRYKQQFFGQLAIANEINENRALNLGKSLLRFGSVKTLPQLHAEFEKITASQLQTVANEIFNEKQISILKYC